MLAASISSACYNIYVECCHIKPVKSFPSDATLKTVNALDNLIGLCANHHIELDLGLLTLASGTDLTIRPTAAT
jgi:hypothetical protein